MDLSRGILYSQFLSQLNVALLESTLIPDVFYFSGAAVSLKVDILAIRTRHVQEVSALNSCRLQRNLIENQVENR